MADTGEFKAMFYELLEQVDSPESPIVNELAILLDEFQQDFKERLFTLYENEVLADQSEV